MLRVFTLHWSIAKTNVSRPRESSFQIKLVLQLTFRFDFYPEESAFHELIVLRPLLHKLLM